MHRSGTSSVAGALVLLGGAAPLHLMTLQPDNERGYWESPVIMALNDDVLAAGGSDWTDWRQFDYDRIGGSTEEALRARAKATLIAEFGAGRVPIIKDPRMCRLMRFWTPVFEEAGWSTRIVLPLRSPLEVAWSLERRDGIDPSLGCLLWLRHVLDAENETRGMVRAVLDWSDFLGDPRASLVSVVDRLTLDCLFSSEDSLAAVNAFVSDDLRHCKAEADELQVHPAISELAREVYDRMLCLVEDPGDAQSLSRLDALRADFETAAGFFDPATRHLESEIRRLRGERDAFFQALTQAHQKLEQANLLIACVTERYAARSSPAKRGWLRRLWSSADGQTALEIVRSSAFFDASHYLDANRDLRGFGCNPAKHYLEKGAREGRDPGPFFSTSAYLERYPDVAKARVNPLVHYETHGRKEKRSAIG